jgi:hypothetical protein
MTKKLTFIAKDEYGWEVCPKPFPAKQAVPQWWKDMTPYDVSPENPNGSKLIVENHVSNATFKKCTPMLDALTTGYIIPLWTDVQVKQINNSPWITWRTKGPEVFEVHGESATKMPAPIGYKSLVVKYVNTWIPKTPPGYSVLVTSPFGYRDLPFHAIPAIIDSDKSTLEIVPPMWVKEGFEGIVEKGTPMFQVTPFKRENWESEFTFLKDGEYRKIEDKNFGSTLVNHYVKNYWSKKSYK